MKRPRGRARVLVIATLVALCAALPSRSDSQRGVLTWVNSIRRTAGAPAVVQDEILARTALAWAETLVSSGVLSHRGADGSSVLDRYRTQGGTDARVGEIIGAGPDLGAVEKGWEASADHKGLVVESAWTHVGWGSARSGSSEVWVVLFCEKLVDGLRLDSTGGSLIVAGTFVPLLAVRALLYDGLRPVAPDRWDPVTRSFSFSLPDETGYFRLGYVSSAGEFRLTNAFTLPPGKESPGGQDRSAIPARSP